MDQARINVEIQELRKDIMRIGSRSRDNVWSVNFGDLFDDPKVEQYYEALAGTLKAAKRQGYIDFKSQVLLKGAHDSVPIILLKPLEGAAARSVPARPSEPEPASMSVSKRLSKMRTDEKIAKLERKASEQQVQAGTTPRRKSSSANASPAVMARKIAKLQGSSGPTPAIAERMAAIQGAGDPGVDKKAPAAGGAASSRGGVSSPPSPKPTAAQEPAPAPSSAPEPAPSSEPPEEEEEEEEEDEEAAPLSEPSEAPEPEPNPDPDPEPEPEPALLPTVAQAVVGDEFADDGDGATPPLAHASWSSQGTSERDGKPSVAEGGCFRIDVHAPFGTCVCGAHVSAHLGEEKRCPVCTPAAPPPPAASAGGENKPRSRPIAGVAFDEGAPNDEPRPDESFPSMQSIYRACACLGMGS